MTMTVPAPGQIRHMLGGQIAIRVEVDTGAGEGLGALWDSGLWDYNRWGAEDPDWVDLTAYVLGVSIHQGAERWGERYETGTASVTVDNTTGIFTPESGSPDPWFREFRPGRRMRIVAIPDPDTGVRVPLFTGRFEGLTGDPADAGHAITASLQLFDFMGDWAAYNPLETTDTGNQRTDLRVEAALDRYGWPDDERDIQVGDHNVTGSTLSDTTLEECQRAADAEGGAFYCSKDGLAVFKNKDWLTTDTRSTVIQGYVGYTEVPAIDPTPIYGPAETVLTGTPESNVAESYELGHTFESSVDGRVTHIRVYKSPASTDPNMTVSLWSPSGPLLSTATQAIAGTGWQTVPLSAPVDITAETVYTVSYSPVSSYARSGTYIPPQSAGHLTILNSWFGFTLGTKPTGAQTVNFWVEPVVDPVVGMTAGIPPSAHAASPATSWELARVVNHAAYAREGGTAQEAEDAQSQSYYGLRSHKRTDLHNTTDGEVLALAVRTVNSLKDLRPRLDEITLIGVEDADNEDLNRLLWDTELGDLLAVQLTTPWGWMVEREVHVVAMDHAITADDWTVRYRLDDAQTVEYDYWILDDPVASVLDQTTRVQ